MKARREGDQGRRTRRGRKESLLTHTVWPHSHTLIHPFVRPSLSGGCRNGGLREADVVCGLQRMWSRKGTLLLPSATALHCTALHCLFPFFPSLPLSLTRSHSAAL